MGFVGGDGKTHMELVRFTKKYGLTGTPLVEVAKIKEEFEKGIIQLTPYKKDGKTDAVAKRKVDNYTGIRYVVKEILGMPHILNTAFEKARNSLYLEYVYCKTDLSKKEISHLFALPIKVINKMIDKGEWRKKPPLEQIASEPKLITLIYKDPSETIVVPEKQELEDVDERYRQEFYKLYARIKQASGMSTPDTAYINGLMNSVNAMSKVYQMEREVNYKMSVTDTKKMELQERLTVIQEKKLGTETGEVTILQMPEGYDRDTQVLLYFLKETLAEKGIAPEIKDDVLGSLAHKISSMKGEDEDGEVN